MTIATGYSSPPYKCGDSDGTVLKSALPKPRRTTFLHFNIIDYWFNALVWEHVGLKHCCVGIYSWLTGMGIIVASTQSWGIYCWHLWEYVWLIHCYGYIWDWHTVIGVPLVGTFSWEHLWLVQLWVLLLLPHWHCGIWGWHNCMETSMAGTLVYGAFVADISLWVICDWLWGICDSYGAYLAKLKRSK